MLLTVKWAFSACQGRSIVLAPKESEVAVLDLDSGSRSSTMGVVVLRSQFLSLLYINYIKDKNLATLRQKRISLRNRKQDNR